MSALALWLLGVALVGALAGRARLGVASRLGLGALLGPAAASLWLVLLLQLGAPSLLGAALGASALAALLVARRRRREPRGWSPSARNDAPAGSRLWLLLPALALGSALVITADARRDVPDGTFDALAIWNHHARLLARVDSPPVDVLHRMRTVHHPDYPLLLPGAVGAQWRLLGHEAPEVARDTAMLFLVALALLTWAASRRWLPRAPSALLTALALLVPLSADKAQGQKADVLVAALCVAAADALASRAHPRTARHVPPALTGVLVALLPWAKNEGLVLAGVLVVATLVVRPARGASRPARSGDVDDTADTDPPPAAWWRPALLAAAPVAAIALLHARLWAPADPLLSDLGARAGKLLTDPERWRTVLGAFVARLDPAGSFRDWGSLGAPWCLAVLLGLAARRFRVPRAAALLGLALALQLAALIGIYLLTNYPKGAEAHLRTSLDRLLLQLLPTALLLAGLLLRAPEREASTHAASDAQR